MTRRRRRHSFCPAWLGQVKCLSPNTKVIPHANFCNILNFWSVCIHNIGKLEQPSYKHWHWRCLSQLQNTVLRFRSPVQASVYSYKRPIQPKVPTLDGHWSMVLLGSKLFVGFIIISQIMSLIMNWAKMVPSLFAYSNRCRDMASWVWMSSRSLSATVLNCFILLIHIVFGCLTVLYLQVSFVGMAAFLHSLSLSTSITSYNILQVSIVGMPATLHSLSLST